MRIGSIANVTTLSFAAWLWALTGANAVCLAPDALNTNFMINFTDNPTSLLAAFPQGSRELDFKVAEIAEASAKMSDSIRLIVNLANEPQASAIGSGLARAVRECTSISPELSRTLTTIALNGGNSTVARAFLLSTEDSNDGTLQAVRGPDRSERRGFVPGVSLSRDSGKLPDPFAPFQMR